MYAKGKKNTGEFIGRGGISDGFQICLLLAERGILAAGRICFWSCKGFAVRNWGEKIIWEFFCVGGGF